MWSKEFSIDTDARPEAILQLFADVGHWPEWNAGTEWVELDGPFAAGTPARMKIPAEAPFPFRLIAVDEHGFEDETPIPDAGVVVRVRHSVEPLGNGRTRIVYRATVDGAKADELGGEIGQQVTADVPDVLRALAARAAASRA
jgi:hypothetical protein